MVKEKPQYNIFFHKSGFTIIELMVVMVIITVIAGVILFNHRKFQYNTEFKNIAYDIALDIRDMQVRGISTSETRTNSDSFFSAFGIHFGIGDTYTLYADTDTGGHTDRWYDNAPGCNSASANRECIKSVTLKTGYTVSDICVSGAPACTPTEADISFKRPNPDAQIRTTSGGATYNSVVIELTSPTGATTSINVTGTGQIYIQ